VQASNAFLDVRSRVDGEVSERRRARSTSAPASRHASSTAHRWSANTPWSSSTRSGLSSEERDGLVKDGIVGAVAQQGARA